MWNGPARSCLSSAPSPAQPGPFQPIPAHSRVPLPQEPELSQQGRVLLGLLGGGLRGLFMFQPEPLNLLQDLPGEGTKRDERRTELSVCTAPEHFCSPSGSFCQRPAQAQGLCSPVAGTDSQPGQGREHSPGNRCRTWRIYSFVRMKSLMAMCLQPPPRRTGSESVPRGQRFQLQHSLPCRCCRKGSGAALGRSHSPSRGLPPGSRSRESHSSPDRNPQGVLERKGPGSTTAPVTVSCAGGGWPRTPSV